VEYNRLRKSKKQQRLGQNLSKLSIVTLGQFPKLTGKPATLKIEAETGYTAHSSDKL
jgi:hypothetical protein